ncbi:prepilin-type N-terminal cleavage/methylation domain-containing protein [Horticoccus luteus]|uniref:Prepilin-type N-terminal cleavage/methylation domain-containing protein n=1 Tax=Horticoccus luteus TaxID=2862869 RepID=A0A8F9XGK9_9BACT|nr:prepilin-type N-terminal cleavage/methylation domain-containing protein [Horticoccus luteus]QYM78340.1 prepilin-type N-terminal cleavage/methylation domain-containing protein [Horticoccus luteus]
MNGRRGFTLLEMLLALALTGLLFVGLNTFIFSMGELWGRQSEGRLFELHTRAVSRWVGNQLREAVLPPPARLDREPISVVEIRTRGSGTDNLITYELRQPNRLMSWPDNPLPDVVCSLQVREREGLVLLWHSRLEMKFSDDPPRETIISPWVTGLSYDYYDADLKRWRTETSFRRGDNSEMLVPQRLRLKFTYGGMTRESMIAIPTSAEGQPNF